MSGLEVVPASTKKAKAFALAFELSNPTNQD
jgi:hypothetical protein